MFQNRLGRLPYHILSIVLSAFLCMFAENELRAFQPSSINWLEVSDIRVLTSQVDIYLRSGRIEMARCLLDAGSRKYGSDPKLSGQLDEVSDRLNKFVDDLEPTAKMSVLATRWNICLRKGDQRGMFGTLQQAERIRRSLSLPNTSAWLIRKLETHLQVEDFSAARIVALDLWEAFADSNEVLRRLGKFYLADLPPEQFDLARATAVHVRMADAGQREPSVDPNQQWAMHLLAADLQARSGEFDSAAERVRLARRAFDEYSKSSDESRRKLQSNVAALANLQALYEKRIPPPGSPSRHEQEISRRRHRAALQFRLYVRETLRLFSVSDRNRLLDSAEYFLLEVKNLDLALSRYRFANHWELVAGKARRLLQRGDYQQIRDVRSNATSARSHEMIVLLDQYLKLVPFDWTQLENRAYLHYRLHNDEEALKDFTSLKHLDVTTLEPRMRRAECLFALGKYDDALRECEQLLTMESPDSLEDELPSSARLLKAVLLRKSGNAGQAISELKLVVGSEHVRTSDLRDATNLLIWDLATNENASVRNPEVAVEILIATERSSTVPVSRQVAAAVWAANNQFGKAVDLQRRAIEQSVNDDDLGAARAALLNYISEMPLKTQSANTIPFRF